MSQAMMMKDRFKKLLFFALSGLTSARRRESYLTDLPTQMCVFLEQLKDEDDSDKEGNDKWKADRK